MKGKVVDTQGKQITGVKISINKNGVIESGPQGTFEFTTAPELINDLQAHRNGYKLSNWDKSPGNGLDMVVYLAPVEYTLIGKTLDREGNPLPGAEVILQPDDPVAKVKSSSKGVFQIKVPPYVRITDNSRFVVNGVAIPAETMHFQKPGDLLHLQLPPKIYTLVFFDKDNNRLAGQPVTVNGQPFTTSASGELQLPLKNPEKPALTCNGYTVSQLKFMPADDYLMVYLQKGEPQPRTTTSQQQDESQPATTENGDESATEATEEAGADYSTEFNMIINDLEMRKQTLIERSTIIRQEMEKVAGKLYGAQDALTPEEKRELERYMADLEEKLIETDVAYEDAQAKTREIVDKMRTVIIVKDSISVRTNEQLEIVTEEKEKVEAERRREIMIFSIVAFFLGIISLILYTTGRRIRKQRNQLTVVNKELEITKHDLLDKVSKINQQKQEIETQSESLKTLNDEISLKNLKLTDNIRYALTVQEAILPSPEKISGHIGEHFVIFHPKDIVSGDFYWFSHICDGENTEKIFVAAVDCTGHGVSGAFMSMIGNALLNEIIMQRHIHDPSDILTCLNEGVVERLQQNEKSNDDGMDIALCCVSKTWGQNTKVTFCGAKRPVFLIKAGSQHLETIKGDRKSIGGLYKNKNSGFNNQEFEVQPDDCLYLCSDGLTDQNNPDRRKFGTGRFVKFLEAHAHLPMQQQKALLETELKNHMNGAEQRDDILVIGLKV